MRYFLSDAFLCLLIKVQPFNLIKYIKNQRLLEEAFETPNHKILI